MLLPRPVVSLRGDARAASPPYRRAGTQEPRLDRAGLRPLAGSSDVRCFRKRHV